MDLNQRFGETGRPLCAIRSDRGKPKEDRVKRPKRRVYSLGEFKLAGFCMANTLGGEDAPVMTQAVMFSDDAFFHHCMRAFAQDVDAKLRAQGVDAYLSRASNFAIVVDPDFTAKLYFDCVELRLNIMAKRNFERGEAVYINDIGDIYAGSLIYPKLRADQHYIICLREGWKFMVLFDLTPEQPVDLESLGRKIGIGMRRLMFEQLYETVSDASALASIIGKGWFAFNELLGAEFDALQRAIVDDFNLGPVEQNLLSKFDAGRLSPLIERWWKNPLYASRRKVLDEGVQLFLEGRYISSIKTLLTEIEGILREQHVPRAPGRQGIEKVLSVAFEEVIAFAGADSIYFPEQFVTYLRTSVFAHFDPDQPSSDATRNTVSHGCATTQAYTGVRALQTILVLDQINRYLTLPVEQAGDGVAKARCLR
ncbi:hypothetical protein [Caulobacter segnis]